MWRLEKRAERVGAGATFAKIGGALGVKTKRLYEEVEGAENNG